VNLGYQYYINKGFFNRNKAYFASALPKQLNLGCQANNVQARAIPAVFISTQLFVEATMDQ
jgi:hypothetical protein